jgi:CheY-like chemotaxis protein
MTRVLLVEDSRTQARQIEILLEDAGFEVEVAIDGVRALEAIGCTTPDVVLTDLQLPEMNGLELVQAIRKHYAFVPVVLMTAHGSEEIATQALQTGAASYVPKRKLARDAVPTLEKIVSVANAERGHHHVMECVARMETHFVLGNDPALVPPLIAHLQHDLERMKFGDGTDVIRAGVALQEALENAIEHGNLELTGELAELSAHALRELAEKRRTQLPYRDRHVYVIARVSNSEACYVVRDEGRGLDAASRAELAHPANLESGGRGLSLIRTFMDEVRFNDSGNEITMVKRHELSGEGRQ